MTDGAKIVAPPTLNGNITRFSDTKFANLFLALAVGAVVLLGALLLFRPSSNQKLQKRIEGYAQISDKRASDRDEGESRSPLFQRLLVATEGLLGRLKYWKHAGFLLQQADMPMRAAELFYIQLGIGAGLGILSMLAIGNVVLSLILFAIGMVLPYMYVKRKAGKRTKKFETQLPDTLVAVAASLRAGHSFAQAMSTIVKDGGEPAAKEFGRVEAETRLGTVHRRRAAGDGRSAREPQLRVRRARGQHPAPGRRLARRDPRHGGRHGARARAVLAQGQGPHRHGPRICLRPVGMPFFIGAALAAINWKYLSPLFTTSAGHIMLMVGLVMIGIGTLILRKMVNFRY